MKQWHEVVLYNVLCCHTLLEYGILRFWMLPLTRYIFLGTLKNREKETVKWRSFKNFIRIPLQRCWLFHTELNRSASEHFIMRKHQSIILKGTLVSYHEKLLNFNIRSDIFNFESLLCRLLRNSSTLWTIERQKQLPVKGWAESHQSHFRMFFLRFFVR